MSFACFAVIRYRWAPPCRWLVWCATIFSSAASLVEAQTPKLGLNQPATIDQSLFAPPSRAQARPQGNPVVSVETPPGSIEGNTTDNKPTAVKTPASQTETAQTEMGRESVGGQGSADASTPTASPEKSPLEKSPASTSSVGDPFLARLANESQHLSTSKWGGSAVQTALLLGALSLAPAILLMTTSYVRIVVVLSLLRQAMGTQQLPPTQVITALSIFLTLLVMGPVWLEVKSVAIDPYQAEGSTMNWQEAWQQGVVPIKRFMLKQIEITGNRDSLQVFYRHAQGVATWQQQAASSSPGLSAAIPAFDPASPVGTGNSVTASPTALPEDWQQIPIHIVLPAFLLSELKLAFLLGFQIFLPFLVVDLVVSTVTVSMGMVMLPPAMVSLPLKLILFVMVDGWNLVVGMLLQSFGPLPLLM
jgi:flagellar biosynthetic protein FliP